MATLANYTDALIEAEKVSVEIEAAVAVVYWNLLDKFTVSLLSSYTKDLSSYPMVKLMATVDHKGIITESDLVKKMLGVAA